VDESEILQRLAVALAIGFVVGLERGWDKREQPPGRRLAGVRTFSLTGLFGGTLAVLAPGNLLAVAVGLLVVGALAVSGYLTTTREEHDLGMTTELALLGTFALGVLAAFGAPFAATSGAIVMALLLSLKAEFHHVIEQLERHELLATLQLLAIAAILVPLLPSRDLGPWGAVNPRMIGMLVLLVASMQYVGYFAVRFFGTRLGLLLTALFGGLSSSTAVTLSFARRAREHPEHQTLLSAGIAFACVLMVPRVAAEIAIVDSALLPGLWPTLICVALVPFAGAAAALRRGYGTPSAALQLANPLRLTTALGYGLLLAVVFVAAEALQRRYGSWGTYGIAATAALGDLDAITLALAKAAGGGGLAPEVAQRAMSLAIFVNTGLKAVLAVAVGGRPMLPFAAAMLAATVAAGVATQFFLH
jgi:uncharacterized membrane protein (DUF4010 family)